MTNIRVGSGFDVHAFGAGDHVMLGGVRVAYSQGVVAHSDGDVILHALCDALLGAAGLGDIGQHFPTPIQLGAARPAEACCSRCSIYCVRAAGRSSMSISH